MSVPDTLNSCFLSIYSEGHIFLQKTTIVITLSMTLSKYIPGKISYLTS